MPIDSHIIDEIKGRIDIVDVISDFVSLKKSGNSYKALSPFSNEKTPSFFVVPAKGIYKDFSSGKGGDAINFIMEHDGLNYIEAIKYLAKKYGIEVEEDELTDDQIKLQNERESLFIILEYANSYFQNLIWTHPDGKDIAISYLTERGYTEDLIKKFELGYSVDEWDELLKQAVKKGHNEDLLEKAGLVIKKDDKTYDRFRSRIIFPIHNLTGKVIGFGARTLSSDKKQPKYINSPETEVYRKGEVLFGLHLAKRSIRDHSNCYIVEGYTDVISLHNAGIENTVSSSGTALTEAQIILIKRYTPTVTILFDGDDAGIRASLRGIDMILEGGLNVKVIAFPEGEDPDSYARKLGINEFRNFLEDNPIDFIRFKIELLGKEESDPIKKAATIKEIVTSISKMPDPLQRTVYVKEASKLLEIEEQILISELNKLLIGQYRQKPNSEMATSSLAEQIKPVEKIEEIDQIALQEKESVRLLINYGINNIEEEYKAHEYLFHELQEIDFSSPLYKRIIDMFKLELSNGNIPDADYFIQNGDPEIRDEVISMIAEKYEVSEKWQEHRIYVPKESDVLESMIYSNVLRLKYRLIGKLIKENLQKFGEASDEKTIEKLQKIHSKLKKSETEIGNLLGIVVN